MAFFWTCITNTHIAACIVLTRISVSSTVINADTASLSSPPSGTVAVIAIHKVLDEETFHPSNYFYDQLAI